MASTQNINCRGNYCLEQRRYREHRDHMAYLNSQHGEAYHATPFLAILLRSSQLFLE